MDEAEILAKQRLLIMDVEAHPRSSQQLRTVKPDLIGQLSEITVIRLGDQPPEIRLDRQAT